MYRIYIEHVAGGRDRLFATVETAQDCINMRENHFNGMSTVDRRFAYVVDDTDEILSWREVRKISKGE